MARQVRLDDDVAEALQRVAERVGGSMSEQANRKLRTALGLDVAPLGPVGRATVKATPGQLRPRRR